ncbi:MAG: hypothetical protein WD361_11265 [Gracilimonas sp.]
MDIGSLVVGLGGLLLGGFSTYLAYKSRLTTFQEKIYGEQIELIKEYFKKIEGPFIYAMLIPTFDSLEQKSDLNDFDKTLKKATGHVEELVSGTIKDILLPDKIINLKNELTSNLVMMTSQRAKMSLDEKIQLLEKISVNRRDLIQQCRENFGIDQLSEETLNQINQSTNKKILDRIVDSSVNIISTMP